MDFTFNRCCDLHPVGNQNDGALLVSVVTPLADDYELYDKAKCILESGTEGGYVLIRLGNDESLGRELRTYLQTEKYVSPQERRHPARIDQDASCGNSPRTTRNAATG